jgi:hypothetical protein
LNHEHVPRWRFRLASRILLALALLLLQQGTLTHALSHSHEPAKPHSAHYCELCHAFASADAEATPPAVAPLLAPGEPPSLSERAVPPLRTQRFTAFASRAPPTLA